CGMPDSSDRIPALRSRLASFRDASLRVLPQREGVVNLLLERFGIREIPVTLDGATPCRRAELQAICVQFEEDLEKEVADSVAHHGRPSSPRKARRRRSWKFAPPYRIA